MRQPIATKRNAFRMCITNIVVVLLCKSINYYEEVCDLINVFVSCANIWHSLRVRHLRMPIHFQHPASH